jgi:hypothetical protein
MRARSVSALALVQLLACLPLAAQQARPTQQSALPHRFAYVEEVMRALDASRAIVYGALAGSPMGAREQVDHRLFARLATDGVAIGETPSAADFADEHLASQVVPADVQALLDRTDALYWNLLSLAADPDPGRLERDGKGLVRAYEAETGLASEPADMMVVAASTPWGAFAQAYPRLHGLLWAQTWLKLAVFEPLLIYRTPEARQAGLAAVLARFWGMLDEAPLHFPTAMPMAPTIAQSLTYLSPGAAAILENEDMLRESIGDILVTAPKETRADAIAAAVAGFKEGGYRSTSRFAWRQMAVMHGVGNQGGFAVGIITTLEQDAEGMNHSHSMTNVMPGMN